MSLPSEGKAFTRAELYELVWSRPRTALAKEIGVSDVAITKHCKIARIPTPGMGHWAKLSAGRMSVRLPLPPRLPGQTDTIIIGADPHAWRWPAKVDISDVPRPPVFSEDLEQQVATVAKRIGKVAATRDLSAPDRSLSKVLEAEAARRAQKEGSYSWHKPRFDEPVFQRHLRLFNSIARALFPVYGLQAVSEGDEWVQGRGTLHHLTLHLRFGGTGMYLRVHEPGEPRKERAPAPVKVTTLRVEKGGHDEELLEWTDQKGLKLENQLTDIVAALVRHAEVRHRAYEQWHYLRLCERREEEIAAIEQRRLEAERERTAAIAAREAAVRDEVIELARRRRVAEDIRAAVASLREHPEVATPGGRIRLESWAARALAVAQQMDPMNSSLEQLFGTFYTGG